MQTRVPPAPYGVVEAPARLDLRRGDSSVEQHLAGNGFDNRVDAIALRAVGQQYRPTSTHLAGFAHHAIEVDIHIGRQVGLVDDQQIALDHAEAALARNVVAAGNIDHENPV